MWTVQSVDVPPTAIINTSHGEILISKFKPDTGSKPPVIHPVASASTMALCGTNMLAPKMGVDPWTKSDPW